MPIAEVICSQAWPCGRCPDCTFVRKAYARLRELDDERIEAGYIERGTTRMRGATRKREASLSSDDPLRLSPPDYFARLAGIEVPPSGMVRCPVHEERTPSCKVYPKRGWHCFSCGAGGSIYDLAAALWGTGTKGGDFLKLKERLCEELGSSQ